jgi:hypothetical protein
MFQTYFSTTGKSRGAVRLGIETLEGRDMPSTLPVLHAPAPQAAWPSPSPTVQVSYPPSISAMPIGEEIPQTEPISPITVMSFVPPRSGEEIPTVVIPI